MMSARTMCFLIRLAAAGVAFCLLLICGLLLPVQATAVISENPAMASVIWPWDIFLWLTALPIFAILVYIFKASAAIRRDEVFTRKMAKWVKTGSLILFADIGFFILGNAVFALLKMSGPPMVMMSLLLIVFGSALAICAFVLSHYIAKAAELKDGNTGKG